MTNQHNDEEKLRKLLKGLSDIVFVKSTNSFSGEEEQQYHEIVDMEAIIRICGEFDREDLKKLLLSL